MRITPTPTLGRFVIVWRERECAHVEAAFCRRRVEGMVSLSRSSVTADVAALVCRGQGPRRLFSDRLLWYPPRPGLQLWLVGI